MSYEGSGSFRVVGSANLSTTDYTLRSVVSVKVPAGIHYRLRIISHVLTPLGAPAYAKPDKTTEQPQQEVLRLFISNHRSPADKLSIQVLAGSTLVYNEIDTDYFRAHGEHTWSWDGFDDTGKFDSRVLRSENLSIRVEAELDGEKKTFDLPISGRPLECDWMDIIIDKNAASADVEMRLNLQDGGVDGSYKSLKTIGYTRLESSAKRGVEKYWSRDGSRGNGIADPIKTPEGNYAVKVWVALGKTPAAQKFKLVDCLSERPGRSTSLIGFSKIIRSAGAYYAIYDEAAQKQNRVLSSWEEQAANDVATEIFEMTSAHEIGHLILNSYAGSAVASVYSWTHKGSSYIWQQEKSHHPYPKTGEIDVMEYHSEKTVPADATDRTAAAEKDVLSILWLCRIAFDEKNGGQ